MRSVENTDIRCKLTWHRFCFWHNPCYFFHGIFLVCYKLFDGKSSLITLACKTRLAGRNTESYSHSFSCCFMPCNYPAGFYLTVHSYWRELLSPNSLELGKIFQALLSFLFFFFSHLPESTHLRVSQEPPQEGAPRDSGQKQDHPSPQHHQTTSKPPSPPAKL